MITVTLAPMDFASDNPFVTPCSANSDPSVGMRICRYMVASRLYERISIPNGGSLSETDPDTNPVEWPSAHLVAYGDCAAAGDCMLNEHALEIVRQDNH